MFEVFRSRKMGILLLLGFSSGLPLYLTNRTLLAWLTTAGVNLSAIGFFSLVALPYSLKFLWSPFLDRYAFRSFGRRRGWLAISQAGLVAALAVFSLAEPADGLRFVAACAVAVAFLSATQDITVDAYRADVLKPDETGAGTGVNVLGYRIALIVTGSLALILADHWSWPSVYRVMSCLMVLLMLITIRIPEPALSGRPPQTMSEAVRLPFQEFFSRQGLSKGISILVFITLYRLGDAMINNMATSFLLQTGFTQSSIGTIQGGVGLIATIVGVLAGGAIMSRIGLNKSLWMFGALQAFSNLTYMLLAQIGNNFEAMVVTIVVENICTGLGTAALVGFLTSLCNPRFSATQYALLSSLMAAGRDVATAPSGMLAQSMGWPAFFLASFIAALPGLLLLPVFAPWNDRAPRLAARSEETV
jgi:PAT family beta-lactamase induction signal transducer AmpG